MALEKLLEILKKIDLSDLPDDDYKYLSAQPRSPDVDEVLILANTVLVDDDGHNIYDNHEVLRKNGFAVFAGEQDRFGWLTGCIQTKKGIIVYG